MFSAYRGDSLMNWTRKLSPAPRVYAKVEFYNSAEVETFRK
jgi:hypothetical protein